MTFPAFWSEVWTAALVNHLWQSTAVTLIAWILALILRGNSARTRYWVWMIASLKFLVPFSLLIAGGDWLGSAFVTPIRRPVLAAALEQITAPFPLVSSPSDVLLADVPASVAPHHANLLPLILPPLLIAVWSCGLFVVSLSWIRGWLRMRATVRASSPMALSAEVPVFSAPQRLDPCVFGIVHPVLLLPEGIGDHLVSEQLGAVIAHEMCHVRRRDNLTAAIHMVSQALFWFHPAVWWIKARLLEERERACDEAVLQLGNQAEVYAESILTVCKFYVESSPLGCVSGVTGSDLKRRIVRIMREQIGRKLDLSRKLLLGAAASVALAVPFFLGLVQINKVSANGVSSNLTGDIAGIWQGTLHADSNLRAVIKIVKADAGGYKAVFYSIDQGGEPIPVAKTTLEGRTVKMSVTSISGTYDGRLGADGNSMIGTWNQDGPLPLTFARATLETAWTIPPKLPAMAADADPSFEVATIGLSKADTPGPIFHVQGRRFSATSSTLSDIISYTYGTSAKQLVGAPVWMDTDKFDVEALPGGKGAPSAKQWRIMWQKLLAERFKLSFHRERRELSVYVLRVSNSGQTLTKSEDDPNGLPELWIHRLDRLGKLSVGNATMEDFAGLLQSNVLDRPVLNQTGLTGRWEFNLNWTPDRPRFAQEGGAGATGLLANNRNSPPSLYIAIQQQLGLKIEPANALTDVIVIDHAERPSDD